MKVPNVTIDGGERFLRKVLQWKMEKPFRIPTKSKD